MFRSTRIWQGLGSVAFLAVLGVLAMSAPAQQVPAGTAAMVNGEPIPYADVKAIIDDRMGNTPVPVPAGEKVAMQKAALDVLIEDQLMRQYLKKNVAPITSAEVNKELVNLDEILRKQTPAKTYAQFLKETKQTEEQLKTDIASRLQWRAFLKTRLTDPMVKKYYDDNKLFFDKVMVRASHILVKVKPDASQAEKQAALGKIQAIRQEIMSGKVDFAAAAKKYSECPSRDKGGDIGHFPYKFVVVEPFARTAFAMQKDTISDVVATDFGYHIIKVTDRTAGEPSQFEPMKESIREVYAQDIDLYQNMVNEARRTARIEVYLK